MKDDATRGLLAAATRIELGGFVIDLGRDALLDAAGSSVELRPQAWAMLRTLALNAGRVVGKDELLDAVWPGLVVADGSVAQAISDARAALGEAGHRVIRNVPRRGYMLVVDEADAAEGAAAEAAPEHEADRPTIAVLAFVGSPGDAAGDWLARGVARDLVAELARNADLRVVSQQASFAFAGTGTPLAEIGRRLRCRFLVDGSVRRNGETLRIDVELVESANGQVVWASRHSVGAAGMPGFADALVRRIAGTLNAKARYVERRALARAPKTLDAYALTVRGILMARRCNAESTRDGRAALERAVAIDPEYAAAWIWLGYLGLFDIKFDLTGEWPPSRLPEAMAQVRRGDALDPDNPAAYRAFSLGHRLARDFDASTAAAQRAVRLAPSSADGALTLALALIYAGQPEVALREIERAIDLDAQPSGWIVGGYAQMLWANGRLEEALRAADDAIAQMPDFRAGHTPRLYVLAELGRIDEARREAAALLARHPRLTAQHLIDTYADSASALRERIAAACAAAGIPSA